MGAFPSTAEGRFWPADSQLACCMTQPASQPNMLVEQGTPDGRCASACSSVGHILRVRGTSVYPSQEDFPSSATSKAADTASNSGPRLEDLPMCPKVGCSFAFLKAFAENTSPASRRLQKQATKRTGAVKIGEDPSPLAQYATKSGSHHDFTMGSVCAELIKPMTRSLHRSNARSLTAQSLVDLVFDSSEFSVASSAATKDQALGELAAGAEEDCLSYAELAMHKGLLDSLGQPAFAPATHFVSHAWKYEFNSFVEAIGNWLEQTGTSQEGTYFWVDAFVVNQHNSQQYPQEWWSTRFMQAVGEIGNTILVLEPWHDPVPFTRAWVIWELYCTSVTGARLHLTMRKSEMKKFNETLVNSFVKVQTIVSSLDVSKSEAYHKVDQDMIHNEIKRTIGFTRLNELVQTRLMQWLTETAQVQLQQMRAQIPTMPSQAREEVVSNSLRLQDNIARMLRECGNVPAAEASYRDLLERLKKQGSASDLLSCMNQLAVTLQKASKMEEAMKLHRECLAKRSHLLGPLHADSLQSTSNLAVLLSQSKPPEKYFLEARELFERAMDGREKTIGPDHVSTLYTVSSLARLLSEAPPSTRSRSNFEAAETLHDRAVTGLIRKLHEGHPLTLSALHHQALHWMARAHMEDTQDQGPSKELLSKALEQLRGVVNLRTEKVGRQHPDTIASENALRECQRLLRQGRQNDTLYATWQDLVQEELQTLNNLEQFRYARSRLRHFGVDKMLTDLISRNIVDKSSLTLTTGMSPFNIFARLAVGVMSQPQMAEEQRKLGPYSNKFMIVSNRPENDQHWESSDPAWCGKASMAKHHKMLILKDLHWEWFNVLTFGMASSASKAIQLLKDARTAALHWVSTQGSEWPDVEKVGLFVQVYSHCSVNAFHLHILDLTNLGPTFGRMAYKNLPLADAIAVIEQEVHAGIITP